MAEETNDIDKDVETEPPVKKALRPSYDPAVHDAYSNNSEIIIGESEVAIAFLQDIGFAEGSQKSLVRIVMNHANFLRFVSYCNTRAKLIQDGYGGKIPTLLTNENERTNEELEQSIEDMRSFKKVIARFDFADDES